MTSIAELARIDRTVDIKASPERVFRALTSVDEVSKWFRVAIEGEIAPGSSVWMTSTNEGFAGQRWQVHIKEMTPPTRFVWEWHPGEMDPTVDYSKEPRTLVTFTIEPTENGTRLSVAETGFDEITLERRAKVHSDNTQGWAEVIVWIRDYVEAAS
ncbi:MAG TPA: SRPBCC family protein [Thermoanaerobaculia bacterium]|nr:SRPBCC family protein [Thermoanaerobaculia bacterium]